jgi:AP-3 complex subunit beta
MGSLSHYINCRAIGYQDLPQFPESPTDSGVRCVAVLEEPEEKIAKQKTEKTITNKKKTFYSDSDESNDDSDDDSNDDDSTDSSSDPSYEKIDSHVSRLFEIARENSNTFNFKIFLAKRKI